VTDITDPTAVVDALRREIVEKLRSVAAMFDKRDSRRAEKVTLAELSGVILEIASRFERPDGQDILYREPGPELGHPGPIPNGLKLACQWIMAEPDGSAWECLACRRQTKSREKPPCYLYHWRAPLPPL